MQNLLVQFLQLFVRQPGVTILSGVQCQYAGVKDVAENYFPEATAETLGGIGRKTLPLIEDQPTKSG